MAKDMDMLNGNLFKKILVFAIPVMLSGMLQLLYNAVDLAVVGQFCGNTALAAVGSTGALTGLIVNVFMGVSIGANVSVAKAIGQGNEKKIEKLIHTAILFSLITGAILTVFGIFTARHWLELMETNDDTIDQATLYLQIYFGGMIFNMLYNFGASILRAVGETKKPLYYLAIAGLVNVGLNLLLVLAFNMDVEGVAIATIVSQLISSILVVICLIRRSGIVRLDLKKLGIDFKCLGEMILIGLPAGIQGSLFSISNVFVQSAVNSFESSVIVAGNTAAANIEGFIYTAMNAFYQACITFTSQNLGAKKLKNCRRTVQYSLVYVVVLGIALSSIMLFFGEQLLSLYNNDPEVIKIGMLRMSIIFIPYFFLGVMDVFVGGLRGLGYSIVPMVVSVLGVCGFRLLWIFTVFEQNHTLETLYWSYPLSWIITALIQFGCYMFVYNKIRKNPELNLNL